MSLKTPLIKKISTASARKRSVDFALSIILILVFGLASCNTKVIFSEQKPLPDAKWDVRDTVMFSLNIEDTLGLYDFVISLRNTTDYPYSNIFLFINTVFPEGQRSVDTLEYMLADQYGKWLGSGRGFYRDNDILYRYNLRFAQPGPYRFEIVHAMRTDTLVGIDEVAFTLRHAKHLPKNGEK